DDNVCSADECDASRRCIHPVANQGAVCRAAVDACDAPETCTGVTVYCPSDAPEPPNTPCDDGNGCTFDDTCDGSGRCGGTAITCTSDPCNTRSCNGTGSCTAPPTTGASCDDGNACTYGDTCTASGQCGGTAITCTSDQCNTRTCNGTASCTVTPKTGASCDDGNACTYGDTCTASGQCGGAAIKIGRAPCRERG